MAVNQTKEERPSLTLSGEQLTEVELYLGEIPGKYSLALLDFFRNVAAQQLNTASQEAPKPVDASEAKKSLKKA